jgi:hypothetical protein
MILTAENYFSKEANNIYMSVSQFKTFEKCECLGLAEVNGTYSRPSTTALLVGSYVDSHFDCSLDIFKAQHPELFKRDGGLKSEYVKAEQIIQRIERDDMMTSFLNAPKQAIMTGVISDVPVKIKVDALHPDKICDLKVMKDFEPMYVPEQGKMSWIEAWRYDLQGAVYQEIVRQNTGEKLPFYLVAATKEEEPDIGIFEVPQELLDFELEQFEKKVQGYHLIKQGVIEPERCEKCNYCKSTKIIEKITTIGELKSD